MGKLIISLEFFLNVFFENKLYGGGKIYYCVLELFCFFFKVDVFLFYGVGFERGLKYRIIG